MGEEAREREDDLLTVLGLDDSEDGGSPVCVEDPAADPVARLESHLAEAREAALLARADLENYRRRTARERLEQTARAQGDLIERLLPVLDNLERAVGAAEKDGSAPAWTEGVRMVHAQMLAALAETGARTIEAVGRPFDPMFHEAVATTPSAEVPEGTVLEEVRKGWLLGERVLRPTQVVTASGRP